MDKAFVCNCGNESFLYFGEFVRCRECCTDFKQTKEDGRTVNWERDFANEKLRLGKWVCKLKPEDK